MIGAPNHAACTIVDVLEPSSWWSISLPDPLHRYLLGLQLNENQLIVWTHDSPPPARGAVSTILGTPRAAQTRHEKCRALQNKWAPIGRLLSCSEDVPDAARVKTALEWAFDSERSDNQTMALLQACMGIEALLGADDQDEPLTTRLADRCAYLLGKGSSERDVLRSKFKQIYTVRSKLIHGRKPRLSVYEQDLLYAARDMLKRVIQLEAQNACGCIEEAR